MVIINIILDRKGNLWQLRSILFCEEWRLGEVRGILLLHVVITNTFTSCLLPTWSFPSFFSPTVSQQYAKKKIVLYYHILTLNRSLLLTDDPSQTLAARILAPSYSWTLIECVGGWCHKGLPRDLKASRKTIEIDLLQSCDDNSSAECLCQLTFSSLKGLAARVKSAYSLSILTKQPRIQCTCFLVS